MATHSCVIAPHLKASLLDAEESKDDILTNGLKFYTFAERPYIPVEFADAAYRYGHSQVRSIYTLNDHGVQGQVFPDCAGTSPVQHDRVVNWAYFFSVDDQHPPQPSKRIDTLLAHSLIDLPTSVVGETEYSNSIRWPTVTSCVEKPSTCHPAKLSLV